MNKNINQLDLTDIYRTIHTTRKEYTFFLSERGTQSETFSCVISWKEIQHI